MPTMVASVKTLFLLLAFHLTDSTEYLFCFADLRHSIFFFQTDFVFLHSLRLYEWFSFSRVIFRLVSEAFLKSILV